MTYIKKDFESWVDKERCPLCNSKLIKKHEGWVCKNHCCPLYFKCEKGWVYLSSDKSREEVIVNEFWNSSSRLRFDKRWNELRAVILKRDNYTCQKCQYKLSDDYYRLKSLHVHHIVPSHKESALFFDEDNLITFCNDCHKIVHLADKHKYGDSS
jgi:5-methylcytosine-specific restriction endonuclease McrA